MSEYIPDRMIEYVLDRMSLGGDHSKKVHVPDLIIVLLPKHTTVIQKQLRFSEETWFSPFLLSPKY